VSDEIPPSTYVAVLCPRCGRYAFRGMQDTPAGPRAFIVCRCLPEPFLDPGSVKVEAPPPKK
jgi:hypothetical protein